MEKINRFATKGLLLNVITEIRFGNALTSGMKDNKRYYKTLRGLPTNTTNKDLLKDLEKLYEENGIKDDFDRVIKKFKAEEYLK